MVGRDWPKFPIFVDGLKCRRWIWGSVLLLTKELRYAMFCQQLTKINSNFAEVRLNMTLTKTDLVKKIMENVHLKRKDRTRQQFLFPEFNYTPLSKKTANDLVESTFEIMKQTLAKGDHVLISGFGKFQVKFKWARKGRNPQTGKPIILKSRRAVTFQTSPKLRKRINRVEDTSHSDA